MVACFLYSIGCQGHSTRHPSPAAPRPLRPSTRRSPPGSHQAISVGSLACYQDTPLASKSLSVCSIQLVNGLLRQVTNVRVTWKADCSKVIMKLL